MSIWTLPEKAYVFFYQTTIIIADKITGAQESTVPWCVPGKDFLFSLQRNCPDTTMAKMHVRKPRIDCKYSWGTNATWEFVGFVSSSTHFAQFAVRVRERHLFVSAFIVYQLHDINNFINGKKSIRFRFVGVFLVDDIFPPPNTDLFARFIENVFVLWPTLTRS